MMRSTYAVVPRTARLPRTLIALAALVSTGASAFCELTWEKREVEVKLTPFEKEVIAKFPFKNTGSKPVKILSARSNCGCTTAMMKKTEYAPGENGEVVAKFTVGARMGLQRKPITVQTDDEKERTVALYLVADIPSVLTMPKSFLLWKEGEANDTRSLTVNTGSAYPVKELLVQPDSKHLQVEVHRVSPTEFRIDVTPNAATARLVSTLQLEAVLDGDMRKRAHAYVSVR
ncbi:DUF1573 domain-containing protein [Verrucomicrobiota bacterium sgz303538]